MLLNLVAKELKYQLKSITLYLFLGILIMFYLTQFSPPSTSSTLAPEYKPAEERPHYGFRIADDPKEKMMSGVIKMSFDLESATTLKKGFFINKLVKLNEDQQNELEKTINKIYPHESLENFEPLVTYEEYVGLLEELDNKLGGSTYYNEEDIDATSLRPTTYEEAMEEFERIKTKDKITNAYARVFADYMGIVAGFFPVFLAAFLLTRDKRSNMHELIYSRRVSSFNYVFSKYLALLILLSVFFLLAAAHSTYIFMRIADINSYTIDITAFFKYTLAWVVPTLMFSIALSMLVSILIGNGVISIAVQFMIWMASMLPLMGDYRLTKLMVRFNELGAHESYLSWLSAIAANRLFFTLLSLLMVAATAYIWTLKRGAVNGTSKRFGFGLLQRKASA